MPNNLKKIVLTWSKVPKGKYAIHPSTHQTSRSALGFRATAGPQRRGFLPPSLFAVGHFYFDKNYGFDVYSGIQSLEVSIKVEKRMLVFFLANRSGIQSLEVSIKVLY